MDHADARSKLAEEESAQGLGEEVSKLVSSADILDDDRSVGDSLANVEVASAHVLGLLAELVVAGEDDSCLVVLVDRQWLDLNSKAFGKASEPCGLLHSARQGHELGFGAGEGDTPLSLHTPADGGSREDEDKTGRRS